ncbi:hypothetical protein FBY35_0426 [Streptomyces sp. SLBN-118]|uniref:hypothetical protein n=1 Tax=Streptomyces sp. SLBN-118 TaxID=2768454 RepID=UPI00114D60FB|nr:hypothetical protein [Streptomyces sp. SLBN-118]TQK50118.1 hypothetical protein FBY35_0426 [Streptomyces sp. SLBN-118]
MSDLLAAAAAVTPFLSAAAVGFAGTLAQSAQNRLADSAVERGRHLLGGLLRRQADNSAVSPEETAAVEAVAQLTEEDRLVLEAAIGRWLAGGSLTGEALLTHVRRTMESNRPGDTITVTSHGENSPAIGQITHAEFHIGRRPDGGARR